jgi:hypothetical protein
LSQIKASLHSLAMLEKHLLEMEQSDDQGHRRESSDRPPA